ERRCSGASCAQVPIPAHDVTNGPDERQQPRIVGVTTISAAGDDKKADGEGFYRHPVLTIVCGKCCERQAANGWRDSKPVPLAENRARRTKDSAVVDDPHASFAEQLCRSAGTRALRLTEQAACDARELLCSRFFSET